MFVCLFLFVCLFVCLQFSFFLFLFLLVCLTMSIFDGLIDLFVRPNDLLWPLGSSIK